MRSRRSRRSLKLSHTQTSVPCGTLKYWEQTRNLKKLCALISYFVHLDTFIVMSWRRNVHVWLGCTKTRRPGIGTVLHWRPPDVHIFGTDPSLVKTLSKLLYLAWFSRYKHFCVLQFLRKIQNGRHFGVAKIFFKNWDDYSAEIPVDQKFQRNSSI